MEALKILKETYDRRISAIERILIAQNTQLRKDRETLAKALESCVGGLRGAVRAGIPPDGANGYTVENKQINHAPTLADVILPQHCACGQLIENIEELERHVERGCRRAM